MVWSQILDAKDGGGANHLSLIWESCLNLFTPSQNALLICGNHMRGGRVRRDRTRLEFWGRWSVFIWKAKVLILGLFFSFPYSAWIKKEVQRLHHPSLLLLCDVATPSAASQGFRRQRKIQIWFGKVKISQVATVLPMCTRVSGALSFECSVVNKKSVHIWSEIKVIGIKSCVTSWKQLLLQRWWCSVSGNSKLMHLLPHLMALIVAQL